MHPTLQDFTDTSDTVIVDIVCSSILAGKAGQQDDPANQAFTRRTYVRTVFAAMEAMVYGMKQVSLFVHSHFKAKLDQDELDLLTETKVYGNGKQDVWYPAFKDNVKGTFKAFAKAHGFDCKTDFGNDGWNKFLQAAEIRNRVTHPKSVKDLSLSDDDMNKVQQAVDWFNPARGHL